MTSSPATTEATTTQEEETITPHIPRSRDGNGDGPQFTVVFRTRGKDISDAKVLDMINKSNLFFRKKEWK